MIIPLTPLHLTQSNLQDFLECPRRFQLKEIEAKSWPAAYSEPISAGEQSIEIGNRFHQLCQQFFSGVDPKHIEKSIFDPELQKMWVNFLPYGENIIGQPYFVEQLLNINFRSHKLLAKLDFVSILPNNSYLIIDWKTSPHKPLRNYLEGRVQTYLYPFVLYTAGAELFPDVFSPSSTIELHYWYPLDPNPEDIFSFSKLQCDQASKKISHLIHQIETYCSDEDEFPLTEDPLYCKFCPYRSLCNRGKDAGLFEDIIALEQEDLSNEDFDIGQIAEIEF